MKTKNLYTLFLLFISLSGIKAQYVTIPDPNFAAWLAGGYSNAMVGNQLDTTNYQVTHTTIIACENNNIQDMEGIQYFDALTDLDFAVNQVTHLPARLPANLVTLNGFRNSITSLPPLPATLENLYMDNNQLSSLPTLPAGLKELGIALNLFTTLPASLPAGLTMYSCGYNQVSTIPALPAGLTYLECSNSNFTALPSLPATLTYLDCSFNQLTNLVTPAGIKDLRCNNNLLTSLPPVLSSLQYLDCASNAITSLPPLPMGLSNLKCSNNQISAVPPFPDSLYYCQIDNNPITCIPPLKKVQNFFWINTQISCLPNYGHVYNSVPNMNTLPLCDVFNAQGCAFYNNIGGNVYLDANNNCQQDAGEHGINNVTVNLWSGAQLLEQTTTHYNGQYAFDLNNFGTYTITLDSAGLPFDVICPVSGADTSVHTALDSIHTGNDFALACKTAFDLVAHTVVGRFRPGSVRPVDVVVGDNSTFYDINCAAGLSGTVQLTINGNAHYFGPGSGATPHDNVTGNTLTWNVSDFSLVNLLNSFDIMIAVDTTALLGDSICFTLTVNPMAGDINPANNVLTICYAVVASWDPNDKNVDASSSIYTSQQWLTYTINFQNTGNDTAIHIYVDDTLDTNLDPATLHLLAYSYDPLIQIKGNAVRFNFPNINLPDSNINEPASHGYVQYKIKLKENLPIGTTISNTAFIYFDFNAPVVTNTTANTIVINTSVNAIDRSPLTFSVFPNPASTSVTIAVPEELINGTLTITDITGRRINTLPLTSAISQVSTAAFTNGFYFLSISKQGKTYTQKLAVNR